MFDVNYSKPLLKCQPLSIIIVNITCLIAKDSVKLKVKTSRQITSVGWFKGLLVSL